MKRYRARAIGWLAARANICTQGHKGLTCALTKWPRRVGTQAHALAVGRASRPGAQAHACAAFASQAEWPLQCAVALLVATVEVEPGKLKANQTESISASSFRTPSL